MQWMPALIQDTYILNHARKFANTNKHVGSDAHTHFAPIASQSWFFFSDSEETSVSIVHIHLDMYDPVTCHHRS